MLFEDLDLPGAQVVSGGHDLQMAFFGCGFEKWLYMGQNASRALRIGPNGIVHFVPRQIPGVFERGRNRLSHAANMAGHLTTRDGGGDGATLAVAYNYNQAGMKVLHGVFHAADDVVIQDVAGVANDE